MSPFIVFIFLVALVLAVVFIVGLILRKRTLLFVGLPGPILVLVWYFVASACPGPQTEFGRRFGTENRPFVSDIQTIKPTMMDGHFVSFRISPEDFGVRIRPSFTEMPLQAPNHFLRRQRLPAGWPAAIQTATTALYRETEHSEVFLLYFPEQQRAYAAVRYDQW